MEHRELTDLVVNSYNTEIMGLGYIARDKAFPDLLNAMMNYDSFLSDNYQRQGNHEILKDAGSGTNILRITHATPELHRILLLSHLACCCELLNGWTIQSHELQDPTLQNSIGMKVAQALEQDPKNVFGFAKNVNNADTIRTVQLLKLLGLLKIDSRNTRQLSLGAGFGRKDMYAVHATPAICSPADDATHPEASSLLFRTSSLQPQQITLIDNDESLTELYGNYNRESNGAIHAIVDNALDAIDRLPTLIRQRVISPFNLIAGIRIDHRMVDDVAEFISRLSRTMDAQADFVISIGAGFSIEEFEGRVAVISGIFDYLKGVGLDPVRIILHSGDTLKESRERPAFGYVAVATHEILYCRLHRDHLTNSAR